MRVLVTGADGFVGRWLGEELAKAGHEVVPAAVELTDPGSVRDAVTAARPDAVAHLAAISFAGDAGEDPGHAFAVNVGGTLHLIEAMRRLDPIPALLVTGSSDVYRVPDPSELPLTESSPLGPRGPYGLSKAAQEAVALAGANRYGMPVVVTRSFNHSGPGQRPVFVLPALARRVASASRGVSPSIPVGNLDVRRDFTDVRDVVVAYRLLLEGMLEGRLGRGGQVFNVASGSAVSIRSVLESLCQRAGVDARAEADPKLVRPDDPPEIRGDAGALHAATGWRAERDLDAMLDDLWAEAAAEPAAAHQAGAETTS